MEGVQTVDVSWLHHSQKGQSCSLSLSLFLSVRWPVGALGGILRRFLGKMSGSR